MKRAANRLGIPVGVLLSLLAGCLALVKIPYLQAKPPKNVTDVASCLVWLKKPMGAYKITDGNFVYYRVTGPAGRFLASGPSAYTFDAQGRFIGWTADLGDLPTPGLTISPSAKREKISLQELKMLNP